MNEHYSFGHFPGTAYWSLGLGQFLGPLMLVFWVGFLHQNCGIMYLVSPPISLAPIGATQVLLRLSKRTGL